MCIGKKGKKGKKKKKNTEALGNPTLRGVENEKGLGECGVDIKRTVFKD